MKKRIFAALLAAVMALSLALPAFALGSREILSGECGDNLTWTFDTETGVLTISGTGDMYDYDFWGAPAPWSDFEGSIITAEIGSGVTSIGNHAFYYCFSLTSVVIPDSVTSIGINAFFNCSSLTSITVTAGNPSYSSLDGVLFNKDQTVLICFPGGKAGDYVIPASVTSIGDYAFRHCSSLASVVIPDSVTSIYEGTFCECSSLTSVVIPNSVTSIGWYAFEDCTSLTSIVIPDSVMSIRDYAFGHCSSLASVVIPDSVTSIYEGAFCECSSLTSALFMGESPTEFGYNVFYNCADDFCIYYTAEHADAWVPNGETEWNGYPIALYEAPPVSPGDVNGDDNIDMSDALLVLRYSLGVMTDLPALEAADVNGDGIINMTDALIILRAALGLMEL